MDFTKKVSNFFGRFGKQKELDSSRNYFPSAGDDGTGDGPGWHNIGGYIDMTSHNDYENAYDNITKIAENFSVIEPYLMDANGKPVVQHKILDAIYSPNRRMDAVKFRKALAVMRSVHDEFYVRVHYDGSKVRGKINPERIIGFTFIETTPTKISGKLNFFLKNGENLTEDDVMIFRDVNPYNLLTGFSPARAARRWMRIDDYISDYQAGFFRNGAVPSGMFIITARTVTEFKDIKAMLEKKHKGAGKNNNVTYSHRTIDPESGKPMNAAIEWVPFKTTNKDLALKDLLEGVTRKTDSAYGVPAEIRGHLQNSNYASVSVAEKVFVKYTLYPFTLSLWSEFTHEMARLTGGFGAAFAFQLDIPIIGEEEKEKAEALKTRTETLKLLLDAGYTLDSAVAALQLPATFLQLKNKKPVATTDKPEVQQTGEAKEEDKVEPDDYDTPVSSTKAINSGRPRVALNKSPIPVPAGYTRCACCRGYGEHDTGYECYRCDAGGSVSASEAKQPIPCDGAFEDGNGGRGEKSLKGHKHSLTKVLDEEERTAHERRLETVIRSRLNEQVKHAADNLGILTKAISAANPIEGSEDERMANDMLELLEKLVKEYGQEEHLQGVTLLAEAGVPADETWQFTLTSEQLEAYKTYLTQVARGFNATTAEAIRVILAEGMANGYTAAKIKEQILALADNEFRARRLAVSEVNRAQNRASVLAMRDIQERTGHKIVKKWRTYGSNPCPLCKTLAARPAIPVEDVFWDKGEEVESEEGITYVNNFVAAESADAHPFCQCSQEYSVVRA